MPVDDPYEKKRCTRLMGVSLCSRCGAFADRPYENRCARISRCRTKISMLVACTGSEAVASSGKVCGRASVAVSGLV